MDTIFGLEFSPLCSIRAQTSAVPSIAAQPGAFVL
jgi:hypothetical protein